MKINEIFGTRDFFTASMENYSASTDGVGSKIIETEHYGTWDKIGIDLVAMNVNDVICDGSFVNGFLNYIKMPKEAETHLPDIAKGILVGCNMASVTLIGGETAFHGNEIDLCGTAIGLPSLRPIKGQNIQKGDVIIGIESSGIHANGFTKAREILGLDVLPESTTNPTTIYADVVSNLLDYQGTYNHVVKGLANVTGGGFNNIKRLKTNHTLKWHDWTMPQNEIWDMLRCKATKNELMDDFNCGYGFLVVVCPEYVENAMEIIQIEGHNCKILGEYV